MKLQENVDKIHGNQSNNVDLITITREYEHSLTKRCMQEDTGIPKSDHYSSCYTSSRL